MSFSIGDIVIDVESLGTVVGKTMSGKYIIEWPGEQLDVLDLEQLRLIESVEEQKEDDGIFS